MTKALTMARVKAAPGLNAATFAQATAGIPTLAGVRHEGTSGRILKPRWPMRLDERRDFIEGKLHEAGATWRIEVDGVSQFLVVVNLPDPAYPWASALVECRRLCEIRDALASHIGKSGADDLVGSIAAYSGTMTLDLTMMGEGMLGPEYLAGWKALRGSRADASRRNREAVDVVRFYRERLASGQDAQSAMSATSAHFKQPRRRLRKLVREGWPIFESGTTPPLPPLGRPKRNK